jgi:hypothetical protein
MILDLSDEEARALLNLLIDTVENDRYPMSPRIWLLQVILGKCGEVGGLPPELVARSAAMRRRPQPSCRRLKNAIPRGGHARDDGAGRSPQPPSAAAQERPSRKFPAPPLDPFQRASPGLADGVSTGASLMNDNQEQLAFHHQIGVALSQWQNNIEMQLYNVRQACTGDQPTAEAYIALFKNEDFTHKDFRTRLKEVNDLVEAKVSNTPHIADWVSLHNRIERAEKGRNALAHHWVLVCPNEKPGRRWCLIPRVGIMKLGSGQKLPPRSLCVRDISELKQRFFALGCALENFAHRLRGRSDRYPKDMEQKKNPLTLAQLTHEIRSLAGCPV